MRRSTSIRRVGHRAAGGLLMLVCLSACGAAPAPSAPPSQGALVVLNKGAATATVIDLSDGTIAAVLPTGTGPHELVVSADGTLAVATDYGGQGPDGRTLTVIALPAMEVVRTIDLGRYTRPHGLAFLPGDSVVAVTSETTRSVVLVDVLQGEVVGALPTEQGGSHMLATVADGSRIFTANGGGDSVSEIDVGAGEVVRTFEVPSRPEAIAVSADGSEVWVGSNAEGTISVIDPASGDVEVVQSGFQWPYRIFITPDQATVVIPDLRGHFIRFIDRATKKTLGELSLPGSGPESLIMDDAGRLYVSLSRQGQVAVIDLDTRELIGRLPSGARPDGIGFSPLSLGD